MSDTHRCEHWLKVIGNFVEPWAGRKFGAFNHIAITNEAGSKPPLLWVFNSAIEFPALAEALGPDQPLIGMRSLNTVVRRESLTTWHNRTLAASYANDLVSYLRDRPCTVGGNCQGAAIAGELARNLVLNAIDVQGFIAMEWIEVPALPLQATLLFGAESKDYNPFLRNIDPWPAWNRLFVNPTCRILPGGHGTYFRPDTISALAGEVRHALALPKAPAVSDRSALAPETVPQTVATRQHITISIKCAELQAGDDVLAVWECDASVLPHLEVIVIAETATSGQLLEFRAPAIAGSWTLQLFLTNPLHGPLTWNVDTLREYRITVVDEQDTTA